MARTRLARIGPVTADPYPWPYDGAVPADRAALICIDWQVDFCGPGGYVDRMGYDLELTRAGLPGAARMLAHARATGMLVIHTREGHAADLSDLPANKRWRSARIGAEIGGPGPQGRILVRGEPGWEIVDEVAPLPGEVLIDKPGKGAFYATGLDLVLRTKGITHLVLTGITTDVCVHTTMREANDRGYECLILSDCTGATELGNHTAALRMVTMQGGVFGCVATSEAVLAATTVSGTTVMPTSGKITMPADQLTVPADPGPFGFDPARTALLLIDMQRDFVEPGGFGESLGNDVSLLQVVIPPLQKVLAATRAAGMTVIHTREGHRGDLTDCPPAKLNRGNPTHRIGDVGPKGRILIRGEYGHDIVDELAPLPGEVVIDKPGKGSFYATDLHELLATAGITSLIITGVTTEVCVHTTVREANDRGYECLVLADCVGSYIPDFQQAGLAMIAAQGGIFGWVAPSAAYLDALSAPGPAAVGAATGDERS